GPADRLAPGDPGVPEGRDRLGARSLRRVHRQVPDGSDLQQGTDPARRPDPRPGVPPPLLERIANGDIDPSFIVTHRLSLEEAPEAYRTFQQKEDGCIKVVLSA